MRTATIFLMILITVLSSCKKEGSYFLQDDYNLVLKAAKRDEKVVFLDFYTVWCGGCKSYEKFVFTDSVFSEYLKSNFYSARINAELPINKKITKRYSIGAYPTLIIADRNGNEIDRIIGYETAYGDNCQLLIDKINRILRGEETLTAMLNKYDANPDSLQLLMQIVSEEFIGISDYKNLKKFALESINKYKNSKLKEELYFIYGYACINDKTGQNPNVLKEILQSSSSPDSMFIEGGYYELLKYYDKKENKDSIDFFYDILINLKSQQYLGYARDYAKFLYENNIKIDLADKLTDDYAKYPGNSQDHWTPFLKAHSLARHGKLLDGVRLFDDWMNKNSDPNAKEIDLWNYYFYVDFALFYNTNLDKALEHAIILEKNQPVVDYKMLLARVLYLNKKNKEAIDKLNEIIPMIENAGLKQKIDQLIHDYQN
jgi:thiol-disulfide isomerase/thioredoxin